MQRRTELYLWGDANYALMLSRLTIHFNWHQLVFQNFDAILILDRSLRKPYFPLLLLILVGILQNMKELENAQTFQGVYNYKRPLGVIHSHQFRSLDGRGNRQISYTIQ